MPEEYTAKVDTPGHVSMYWGIGAEAGRGKVDTPGHVSIFWDNRAEGEGR